MTLYKGPAIELFKSAHTSLHGGSSGSSSETTDQNWVTGTLAVMGSITAWAGFFILQVSKDQLITYIPNLCVYISVLCFHTFINILITIT